MTEQRRIKVSVEVRSGSARANRKRESVLRRDLRWELARYAGLSASTSATPDGASNNQTANRSGTRTMMNLTQDRIAANKIMALAALLVALMAAMLLAANPSYAAGTTFTVNSTADTQELTPGLTGDVITLRDAIARANSNANPSEVDRINFDIPGTGVHTISPGSPLPPISEPVVINGYSQPGSSVNTLARGTNAKLLVQIDGTNAGRDSASGGLTINASNTVVKGLVINRVTNSPGIEIAPGAFGEVVRNVRIEGNFIGTDPSGTLARGNGLAGVDLFAVSESIVGGSARAARNLISGNNFDGVFIDGGAAADVGAAENNQIRGNLIGIQKDGIKPLGNGAPGVTVFEDSSGKANGNFILSNSIFSNKGIGIDLDDDGSTANDAGDTDTGSNNLQNKPSLGSAKNVSGKTTVRGSLSSRPGATYTIQFFSNPSGTGQGRTFLGQKSGLNVDGSGKGTFTFSPSSKVAAGQTITATATNEFTGDTSEFSAAKGVVTE